MNNILITGISGGIGKSTAAKLLAGGSSVIGICRTVSDSIAELKKQYPQSLTVCTCDLTQIENYSDWITSIAARYGPIEGFVHCAGFDKLFPIGLSKSKDLDDLWNIHAKVPMLIISAISKRKNHAKGTSIVLLSSQATQEGAVGHTAYAAAKGALEGYLKPAAAELMDKDMRINILRLGVIDTPMSQKWREKLDETQLQRLHETYPHGIGSADDAADIIVFLLSNNAAFINGQIITADGGHSSRKI